MFRNFFKITLRIYAIQKYYSIINTLGLALGIAACLLIILYVQDELSYETNFKNHDQIYRLVQDFPMGNHLSQSATVPFPTKNTLLADYPEIKEAALIFRPASWGNIPLIKLDEDDFYEDDFIFAEESFFQIYDFDWIKGDPATALNGVNQIVLTKSTANKYFGSEDPMGKRVNLNGFRDLEVVGVIDDLPENTHLYFTMIASFKTYQSFFNNPDFFDNQWVWVAAWLYFTVEDEPTIQRIKNQLPQFVANHYPENLREKNVQLYIQKADDIHLNSHRELEFKANSNIQHIYLFSIIAFAILIIAIINFMNLSTSRSAKRAKEVGIRKVMGSSKRSLISQYMGEAIFTTLLSVMIALLLINLALPWFNNLTGKTINIDLLHNPSLLLGIIILIFFVGIMSGSYPALILSSYQPVNVLKGKFVNSNSGNLLRKVLVISQFVVSIVLIIGIGIVNKQLKFIHNKDLGFNQERILLADVNFNFFNKYNAFKTEVLRNQDIASVSIVGGSIPGQNEVIENAFLPSERMDDEHYWFSTFFAGHDFEKVLEVEFLEGHSFKVGSSVDSTGFIINESAAKALGWERDEVIGKYLNRLNGTTSDVLQTGQVIGLVKDYNYRPLYEPIKPLVILMGGGKLSIKVKSEDLAGTIAIIEEEWDKHYADTPFRYSFLKENFDSLYQKEEKFSATISSFSVLAIFIACLGLLGLSSFATEIRKKRNWHTESEWRIYLQPDWVIN